MFKSLLFILLIGTVTVKADFIVDFLVDNIIEPFVTSVIDNTATLVTNAILGLFGKRDALGFLVDNIIEPFVTSVIDNTATLVTNAILGLFGKRDALGFLVDNIIEPFVTTVIDNTATLITNALLGLFGKRDALGFLVDNIIEPFVTSVIDNTATLVTNALLGLFGKRGLDFTQVLVPFIQQFLPSLIQATLNAINHLITAIFPLAKQEVLHLAGPSTHVGIVKALDNFDQEMKLNVHLFLSNVINAAQAVLNHLQLNQFVAQLQQFVSFFLNLSHYIEPIINHLFALLSSPFVGQLVGQILG